MANVKSWAAQTASVLADYEGITHTRYAAALAAFTTWYTRIYTDEPDAALLTDEEIRTYRVYLTGKDLKAATVNAYLAPLRVLVRAQGRTLKVKGMKLVAAPVEPLDARELGRLLNALDGRGWLDKRDMALVAIMARTGLRVSEVLALKVADLEINPRSGKVLVRHGKGSREREVPLSAEARSALHAYLDVRPQSELDLVFLSCTLVALNARDVQRLVVEAARRAGIKTKVTPHILRHTFATRFLEQSPGDIRTLAALLGHANISTTARYTHPRAQRMQEMVEEL